MKRKKYIKRFAKSVYAPFSFNNSFRTLQNETETPKKQTARYVLYTISTLQWRPERWAAVCKVGPLRCAGEVTRAESLKQLSKGVEGKMQMTGINLMGINLCMIYQKQCITARHSLPSRPLQVCKCVYPIAACIYLSVCLMILTFGVVLAACAYMTTPFVTKILLPTALFLLCHYKTFQVENFLYYLATWFMDNSHPRSQSARSTQNHILLLSRK